LEKLSWSKNTGTWKAENQGENEYFSLEGAGGIDGGDR
jgi:hypothetical protein